MSNGLLQLLDVIDAAIAAAKAAAEESAQLLRAMSVEESRQ
jgi:hypothetical protein